MNIREIDYTDLNYNIETPISPLIKCVDLSEASDISTGCLDIDLNTFTLDISDGRVKECEGVLSNGENYRVIDVKRLNPYCGCSDFTPHNDKKVLRFERW